MTDPASRFSGVASQYDAVRPMPPAALADVIRPGRCPRSPGCCGPAGSSPATTSGM
jgi:hypothetical protein